MKSKYVFSVLILGVLLLISCSMLNSKYKSENVYNNIRINIESDKQYYPFGESIPIKVTALNTGNKETTVTSEMKNIDFPVTNLGLTEPRPVYDLIFVGELVNNNGEKNEYIWLWSEETGFKSTDVSLTPNENKYLIDYRWTPPEGKLLLGAFYIRFADVEYPTGISLENPKR